ncbi:aspartyl protease family protein [Bryobacter aggregatus]|uniref:aspartyl protease family protein n=1 Tax=Bryobacter aggregatus TaxID=360054 RepID=UPI0004E13277|nr:aspartyl protease family protein [Bryobacter aggregatus]
MSKGIGTDPAAESHELLAEHLAIGKLEYQNVRMRIVDRTVRVGADGLIGADVFLEPHPGLDAPPECFCDYDAPLSAPAGWTRAIRSGNHLFTMARVNDQHSAMVLIDSGATLDLLSKRFVKGAKIGTSASNIVLQGVQGKVADTELAREVALLFAGLKYPVGDMVSFDMDRLCSSMGVEISGVLGMPLLLQLTLTIDYRNGFMRFAHEKN